MLGPTAPVANYVPGYAFDDDAGWITNDPAVVHIGNAGSPDGSHQTVDVPITSATLINSFAFDSLNWFDQDSNNALDINVGGFDGVRLGPVSGFGNPRLWDRALTEDWSTINFVSIDFYLNRTGSFLKNLQVYFIDGSANEARFDISEGAGDIVNGQWREVSFNLATPDSVDPGWDDSNIVELRVRLSFGLGEYVALKNFLKTSDGIGVALIIKNPVPIDLSAQDDAYRLTYRLRDIVDFSLIYIILSNENTGGGFPTNYKLLQTNQLTPYDTIQTRELISTDVGTPGPLTGVQTVIFAMLGAVAGAGSGDVFNLERAEAVPNPYSVASGEVLQTVPDVLRHFLTEISDAQGAVINEASWAQALVDLASQTVAVWLSQLGDDDVSVLHRLGIGHRHQLLQRDTNAETEFLLQQAQADLLWPTPTTVLTEWGSLVESSVDGLSVVNRRAFLAGFRVWLGDINDVDAYTLLVQATAEQNDLDPTVPTQDLIDSEAEIGRREAPLVVAPSSNDLVSLGDSAAYYTLEELFEARVFSIASVPWTQGYALERGDLVQFKPEYESSTVNARVISVTKFAPSQLVTLICVEVRT